MSDRGAPFVPEITIYPTAKFLKAGAILAAVIVLGLEVMCLVSWNQAAGTALVMIPPFAILAWPAMRAMQRRLTKAVVTAERLRYETGLASKSTRTIQLSKVQDVRVDQRMLQRLFDVGDISIETAGEASRLTLHDIDSPQTLADEILNRAQKGIASM
jgi:uncharacterized membrane protein YdbT with pleckstrin-like domain